jgi:hypothetical protein
VCRYVENLAFVIDGTPQIHPLVVDANDHLIQVPRQLARSRRSRSRRATPSNSFLRPRFRLFCSGVRSFAAVSLSVATAQAVRGTVSTASAAISAVLA